MSFHANIGGWIGRKLAEGDPMAIVAALAVLIGFAVTYQLMVWWKNR